MKIKTDRTFDKNFRKLPKKLQSSTIERIKLFLKDRNDPLLKDHALKGKMVGQRAFSVTGDYRVVYYEEDEQTAVLLRVGRHSQVYS